ncbi:hypothetical protein GCM10020000_43840 [Streptomyces olivoverticillatus]
MEIPSPYGSSESKGDQHTLHYELSVPHPQADVWAAIATPEGLPTWLAAAEPFEQREGGAITLRWLNTDPEGKATVAPRAGDGLGPAAAGRVHGRHPRPDPLRAGARTGERRGTLLHFTNELTGAEDTRLDCLAGWHHHFEYLLSALAGHPADWSAWQPDRWRKLRTEYQRGWPPQ